MVGVKRFLVLIFTFLPVFGLGQEKNSVRITVFIHGSVHCHLLMLSPQAVWNDAIEQDSWYLQMVSKIRQNPLLWQTRPMLDVGPQEITRGALEQFCKRELSQEDSSLAIYPVVAAYDALAQRFDGAKKERVYYTYGHLGLLSQAYRKKVGAELYHWLVDLVASYAFDYDSVELDLVAHSHGGNIALWLGHYETVNRRGLYVDNLVMDGTPLQVETFEFAYKPIFGRVFNRYSDGDRVQGNDRLSTSRGRSYKKFSDPRLPVHYKMSHVHDVRLLVNYQNKAVDHGNMYLMDESHPATQAFRPVPFMVFTPAILAACSDVRLGEFECNVIDSVDAVWVEILSDGDLLAQTDNFQDLSKRFSQLALYNWQPDYSSRLRSKPARLGRITLDALKELWNNGVLKKEEVPKLVSRL